MVELPFDPATPVYCMACGSRLERLGHMFGVFMLCPRHGEFTPGPVIQMRSAERTRRFEQALAGVDPGPEPEGGVYPDERWLVRFPDEESAGYWQGAWENIRAIDARHAEGGDRG